ncbi:restriction endonuclease subunit S [candidate division NPL-UPA2 bacterium]|nr:restriction endonuclease subunit S [candidate division NPL-UPA2 bacterium]
MNKSTISNLQSTIPKGWRWVRLGEVCEIIMGQSPPGSTYTDEPEGLPFFQGKADFGDYFPKVQVWCTQPIKIAKEGDILISVRAPVGPVNMNNSKCCIGRGLVAIRCKDKAVNWFIFWYLRSIEGQITSLGSGSTFGAITRDDLVSLQIPLPPLNEQKRIAARIQELMQEVKRARAACEKQLEAAKALPSAYLREVFESEEAKNWEKKRLGEVCEIITGSTPRTDDPANWNGDILWATPNDMGRLTEFTIDDTERKISKKGFESCSTELLSPGSVLLTTRAPIGHLAINLKPMCTNQGFKSLIPSSQIHNWFLFFALKYFIPVLQSLGRGQTFTEISKRQVESFEIPLPDFFIQQRIAAELKEKNGTG